MKISRPVILGTLAVAIVLIISAVTAYFVPVLKVSQVEVTGNERLDAAEIVSASGIEPGQNILRVEENASAANVAALPWVAKVSVHRALPTKVRVEVQERQVLLFANRNDGPHLIDSAGTPFVIDTPPPGAKEVSGTGEDDPQIFASAVEILNALDPATRDGLERINVKSKYEFTLFFAGGKEVYWGSAEQKHDKAIATKTVLTREGQRWNVSNPGIVAKLP